MAYHSRIPADPAYLEQLGRAFYNFTYLEAVVVSTIATLSADGHASVPRGRPAGEIARALNRSIDTTDPPLPDLLRRRLVNFAEQYRAAIEVRNKLLHARPYTAEEGAQRLQGGGYYWPPERVDEAAKLFGEAAIEASTIYHGALAAERALR